MTGELRALGGLPALVCSPDGPLLIGERSASDLIGEAYGADVALVVVPLERLGPDFLRLATGVAGGFLQKLVNYRFRVAIVGDVSEVAAASKSLADFVRESNRGRTVWFAPDLQALEERLRA